MYYMAVCDDQRSSADYITDTLEKKFTGQDCPVRFESYTDPMELRHEIGEGKHFDALFLDIDMPELDGLSLCRLVREKLESCLVVFISNQEQLVFQAFAVQPFRFVRKFYFLQEVDELVGAVSRELGRREKRIIRISGLYGKDAYAFDVGQIQYIEVQGKKCRVVTGENTTEITARLKDFEVLLEPYAYIKIHRSYLVNPLYVFRIERDIVSMDTGVELPMSRNRVDQVREAFFSWSRRGEPC